MKSRIYILLFTIIVASSFNFIKSQESQSRVFFTKGYEHLKLRDYRSAIILFDSAIIRNPQEEDNYQNRAYCYTQLKDYPKAVKDYESALTLNNENYNYYLLLASLYYEIDSIYKALSLFSQAINTKTDLPKEDLYYLFMKRGIAKLDLKKYKQSLSDLDSALILDPELTSAYQYRGLAKFFLNDNIGACIDWYKGALNGHSVCYEYLRKYCKRAKLKDYNFNATNIDSLLKVKQQTATSIAEIMPEFPGGEAMRMHYIASNIEYPLEARANGIQGTIYTSFIVEKDGTITNAKILRGIGGGCDEEALRTINNMPKWEAGVDKHKPERIQMVLPIIYKSTTNRKPPDFRDIFVNDMHFGRGFEHLKNGKYSQAIKHFTKSVNKKGESHKESIANRAICYYKIGDINNCILDAEKATSFENESINEVIANLFMNIGNDYKEKENFADAKESYSKGLQAFPHDTSLLFQKAKLHFEIDEIDHACKDYKNAKNIGLKRKLQILEEYCTKNE